MSVEPGPRLSFKSAILREVVIYLLLAPFIAGSVGLTAATAGAWLTTRSLAVHRRITTGSAERGPVRTFGEARRDTPVTSPAGANGVAWVAAVGYMASSKSSTWFEPICTRADVSDLWSS